LTSTPNQSGPDAASAPGAAFFPVAVDSLDAHELELDLYLMHEGRRPVLYRSIGSAYSMADCVKLAERGVHQLFVPIAQHRAFQRVTVRRLVAAWEDPELHRDERVRVVRGCCGKMIEDLMCFPHVPGIARTIGQIADRFGGWCVRDRDRFGELMDMGEHDFEAVTHMMNVGVGCGMLCVELLGPDAPTLRDVLQGGLMHDIGKRDLPAELLQKEGKLTDEEWTRLRVHPVVGVDMLTRQRGVSQAAFDMTRDHHERLDGRGYPAGVKAAQIGPVARMCAVVDIYEAMASARPHRAGVPARRVLESMRAEVGTVIDRAAFEAWERVVERLIERDPGRCVPDWAGAETPRLRTVIPSAPKQAVVRAEASAVVATRGRAYDLPVRVSGLGGADEGVVGRLVAVSPAGRLRLVLRGAAPAGERIRVEIEGRAAVVAWVCNRSFGPGGEPVVECVLGRGGVGGAGGLRRAS
jgi:hypothetical protein